MNRTFKTGILVASLAGSGVLGCAGTSSAIKVDREYRSDGNDPAFKNVGLAVSSVSCGNVSDNQGWASDTVFIEASKSYMVNLNVRLATPPQRGVLALDKQSRTFVPYNGPEAGNVLSAARSYFQSHCNPQ